MRPSNGREFRFVSMKIEMSRQKNVRKEEGDPKRNGSVREVDTLRSSPDREAEMKEAERFMTRKEKAFRRLAS